MNVTEAFDNLATALDQYIVAWKIGGSVNAKFFGNYVDAEEFLFTQVPTAATPGVEFRFIAIPNA